MSSSDDRPVIYKPLENLRQPFFRHAGDTFREMIDLWESAGLVDVVMTSDGYVWLGDEHTDESIILYDRPTMQWWNKSPPKQYAMALFGNHIPTDIPRAFAWTFWGRRPALIVKYEQRAILPKYDERTVSTIFLGKIENQIQQRFRDPRRWEPVIEEFTLVIGARTPYPHTQSEYLERLVNARYGLCLRGYGPKCNREIELMALGTVPIVTPEVDMEGYFDPPKLGQHYFIARDPADVSRIVQSTTPEQWQRMSDNCRDWHRRNASVVGSFYQTMRLVNTLKTSVLAQPVCVMRAAKSVPLCKLPGMYRVAIDTVFFERPFSGISRVWDTLLDEIGNAFHGKLLTGIDLPDGVERIELVLLLREKAQIRPELLQRFAYIGIPQFRYENIDGDIEMLDDVVTKLNADLFISTYYTLCTAVDSVAVVHDMIPERFRMAKDAMWNQKDMCLSRASYAICVSEASRQDLFQYGPPVIYNYARAKNFTPDNTWVVHNAFDDRPFATAGVDNALSNPELAQRALKSVLNVSLPFVLVVSSNANAYKNLRLVRDCLLTHQNTFAKTQLVVLCNNKPNMGLPANSAAQVVLLSGITDRQLGMLYGLASALIYPSRCEGFGLPVLEAFWSECPVICCRGAGAIPEVGDDGCWYVSPDNPEELHTTLQSVLSGGDNVRRKLQLGLDRLPLFSRARQSLGWLRALSDILTGTRGVTRASKDSVSLSVTPRTATSSIATSASASAMSQSHLAQSPTATTGYNSSGVPQNVVPQALPPQQHTPVPVTPLSAQPPVVPPVPPVPMPGSVAVNGLNSQGQLDPQSPSGVIAAAAPAPVAPVQVKTAAAAPAAAPAASVWNGMHLIVQYFNCGDVARQAEYDYCVQANLANPHVAKLHVLLEPETVTPDWLRTHAKYVEFRTLKGRVTYKQIFDYANSQLSEGNIAAYANLDIFLDHNTDWGSAAGLLEMPIVLALSRHEFDGQSNSTKDERLQRLAYANAQDAWVFRTPIFVKECDFATGMLGCDNAIGHRLKISNYIPINSPDEFKIHHFDVCRGKRGDNFLAHHTPNPEQPENRGYYLLPDYGALSRVTIKRRSTDAQGNTTTEEDITVPSIDQLMANMGLGSVQFYRACCDVMTNYIKLANPQPKK